MQQTIQEEIIKIQPKGLLTIPKNLRLRLGFVDNSLVRVKEEKGRLIMEAVRTIPYPARSYTDDEINGFFELDKNESKGLKIKRLI